MNQLGQRLQELGRELALEQDRALEQDHSLGAVRARLSARSERRGRGFRPRWALVGLVALIAAAGALSVVLRARAPIAASFGEQALSSGDWVSATEAGAPAIRFSDGSSITLSQGSRARVATLDAAGAHLVLEAGEAAVRVTPNHGARYRLSLGPFAVDVTGTRFDVGFRPSDELFTLTMREGKVIVSGCLLGEGRTLLAGESLRASCRTGHFEISSNSAAEAPSALATPSAPAEPAEQALAEPGEQVLPSEPSPPERGLESAHNSAAGASWQSLAKQARFAEAYAAAASAGFGAAVSSASTAELLVLGDTARLAGKPSDALTAYLALRSRAVGSPSAKQAAFSIARVHFDQRASYAEAARWFRTYLAEQPGGPLAREAEGRLMEALSRSGDRDAARQVAEEYLAKYPHGAHERVARQLLPR